MRTDIAAIGLLAVIVLGPIFLTACRSDTPVSIKPAPPENVCRTDSLTWHEIIPGQSTKADVIRILGQPSQKGRRWSKEFFLYPPIRTVAMTDFGNLIVFRKDDVVEWLDVWVSNSDGKFHTVAEFVQVYGPTLDIVYLLGEADFFGPDHAYVWSECGVAVTAIHIEDMEQPENETRLLVESVETSNYQLNLRYPDLPRYHHAEPDVRQIVMRQFLFQRTDFATFDKTYANSITDLSDRRLYQLDSASK